MSSKPVKSGDMRRYPSGYPYKRFLSSWPVKSGDMRGYLMVNQGQTNPLTRKDLRRLLHFFSSRDSESGDRPRYLMVVRTFHQPRRTSLTVSGWCWSSDSNYFQNFCKFLLSSSGDIQARRRTRFFSAGRGRSSSIACWNVVVIPFYHFQDTEVLLTLLMPFLFFLNDRSRWLGYWSAEWCSARTKLVSYLYFAFISNKR